MLRVSLRDRQVSGHVLHKRDLQPSRTLCLCQPFRALRLFDCSFCRAASFRLTVLQCENSRLTFENNKITGVKDILEKYSVSLSLSLLKKEKKNEKRRRKKEKEKKKKKKRKRKGGTQTDSQSPEPPANEVQRGHSRCPAQRPGWKRAHLHQRIHHSKWTVAGGGRWDPEAKGEIPDFSTREPSIPKCSTTSSISFPRAASGTS